MQLLFLDDDADLRQAMTELAVVLGHQCVALASYAQLVALGDRVSTFRIAVLDINLGADVPSGIDAFRWLQDRRFEGRILFLTGHGLSHPMVAEASRLGVARVLQKPIPVDELARLLAAEEAFP
jgi:ActR/RegA family two-component response regulator